MMNFPELIAGFIRDAIGDGLTLNGETLAPSMVYSDANPSRDWFGSPTLEVDVIATDKRHFVTGATRETANVAVLYRAKSRDTAGLFVDLAVDSLLVNGFTTMVNDGVIDDWIIDSTPIAADARNLEIGETFSAQINVILIGKRNFAGF